MVKSEPLMMTNSRQSIEIHVLHNILRVTESCQKKNAQNKNLSIFVWDAKRVEDLLGRHVNSFGYQTMGI